jgi:hypothetical protein
MRRLEAYTVAGIVLAETIACHGCASSSTASSADGGALEDARAGYLPEASADAADVDGAASSDRPPPGWVPYLDYDPACGLFIPNDSTALPSPLRWEPCPASVVPSGVICQNIKFDWSKPTTGSTAGDHISPWIASYRDPNGAVIVQISRFVDQWIYRTVEEIDNRVLQAVLHTSSNKCTLGQSSVQDGKVIYRVYDSEATGEVSALGGGAMGGRIGELRPRVLLHSHDQTPRGFAAGSNSFIEHVGPGILHPWDDPARVTTTIVPEGDDVGLSQTDFFYQGDDLFWNSGTSVTSRLKVRTANGETRTLVGFGDDLSQAAADLGTDGKDMVWAEAYGRSANNGPYPSVRLMTAPYTTAPAALLKKRLRSEDPARFRTADFTVGCGYAAHSTSPGVGVRIIRLSDGVSWRLVSSGDSLLGRWARAVAITCSEVFLTGQVNRESQVVRVRLDSLGPGEPAD